MSINPSFAHLSPAVVVHLVFAVGALVLGPLALWLPKRTPGHRAGGYAWVLTMLGAAVSSLFIRDFKLPNLAGYTPIHLVTVATFIGVGLGLWHISRRNVVRHRRVMQITYGAVLAAGAFALLPQRFLGTLLWQQAAGLV